MLCLYCCGSCKRVYLQSGFTYYPPAMNEVQRQAYLKVMGIQTYFPKSILVGAKPSPHYEFPPEALEQPDLTGEKQQRAGISIRQQLAEKHSAAQGTQEKAAENLAEPGRRGAKQPATARSGRPGETPQSKPVAVNVPAGSSQEPTKEEKLKSTATSEERINGGDVTELRFKLRYIRISEQLAVIDEVPHQKSERLGTEDLALLRAILAALKLDTRDVEFRSETFAWPLAENLTMKNDPAEEAKRALSGFVQMRQETDRFSNLLVFAAQTDSLLMKQENGSDIRDFEATSSNYFITVTSSLHSMLAYPALKREVWQQLQPLRRRLAVSN